jgi:hypothetical protein
LIFYLEIGGEGFPNNPQKITSQDEPKIIPNKVEQKKMTTLLTRLPRATENLSQ